MTHRNLDIFEKIWVRLLTENQALANNLSPKGYVLGGQPGAGKSHAIRRIVDELSDNVLVINADDFRRYHPEFEQIQNTFQKEASKHTAQFSGEMADCVIERAIAQKYNVVIEGTFRTAVTPLKTLQHLKANGYETCVDIQTTSKEVSWQSTVDRYHAMERAGIAPRYTPKDHHDLVVESLPDNADKVFNSGLADHFRVYAREKMVFDRHVHLNQTPSVFILLELNAGYE